MKNTDHTKKGAIEENLENGSWQAAVRKITLPRQMKSVLLENCTRSARRGHYKLWYIKAIPAFCILFILAATGITAHAFYMNTHFNVFFEADITKEELGRIETELMQIEGVSSCRYVDADTAWKEFGETYLTPEIMADFEDNPLADSANFKVGVSLQADTEKVRACMERIEGVRRVSGLWEE